MAVKDVLTHLIHYGPARNEAERGELLDSLDDDGTGKDRDKDKDNDTAAKRTAPDGGSAK